MHRKAFKDFFKRCLEQQSELGVFASCEDFHKGVRCGILHQAETTRGWRINRKGPLFDPATKTINATKFHGELKKCLEGYCCTLRQSAWEDDVWTNLRTKMASVIENCQTTPH